MKEHSHNGVSTGEEIVIDPIRLGSLYDFEFDNIYVNLECLTCSNDEAEEHSFFAYNKTEELIKISPNTPIGKYRLQITLRDDNEVEEKDRIY